MNTTKQCGVVAGRCVRRVGSWDLASVRDTNPAEMERTDAPLGLESRERAAAAGGCVAVYLRLQGRLLRSSGRLPALLCALCALWCPLCALCALWCPLWCRVLPAVVLQWYDGACSALARLWCVGLTVGRTDSDCL